MNARSRNDKGLIDKPLFLSPKIRFNKIRGLSLNQLKNEEGFTLVELIVVVMMIGILSSIAIPQFMSAADKAKQKEASAIVASMIKAATAYQTEYGNLPQDASDLSEYARFQACTHGDVDDEGGSVCKGSIPESVQGQETEFFSSSGHYFVQLRRLEDGGDCSANPDAGVCDIFQVLANPNGRTFDTNGSGVAGCYNPTMSVAVVEERSSKDTDGDPATGEPPGKGIKDWKTC